MRTVHVYAAFGGWFYVVRVNARVVVLGWCLTREDAEVRAVLA